MDARALLDTLTLKQKIGQLLIFGWAGETEEENTTVSAHARVLLEEFEVGGIILLGRNVSTPARTAQTMNELQERSGLPLFIIADQEGGMVARFKDPYVVFPGNMALGASGDPAYAYRAAKATAEELLAVGVNFDFAPCVDVNNNPLNPIIGTRSYGDSAEIVSRFASEAIRGYTEGGVLTSAKHFPGHGDTSVDSHLALPVVDFPRERLERVEFAPFRAAIDAGVASIMTTHIVFPALDPELPSTISKRILTGLLREEMGWDGLVVTDCLEMKGVALRWGTPAAAIECIKAGADCPLICHTLSTQREAYQRICEAVDSGELSEERLNQSVLRVLRAKERFGLLDKPAPADPDRALAVVSDEDKSSLALEIARRAVTVVRDERGTIPAALSADQEILVTGLHPQVPQLAGELARLHANVRIEPLGDLPRPSSEQEFGTLYPGQVLKAPRTAAESDFPKLASKTALVVVATCRSEPWTSGIDEEAQAHLVRYLAAQGAPLVVVALREPYDLRQFSDVPCYVASYGYRPEQLRACAEVLLGVLEATGALPVDIPGAISA
ncbi:MAG: hypothetical protein IT209_00520 [Armatimonadetes bacterium]|nr:hypothetical protein [Armatimonadota bacterium]